MSDLNHDIMHDKNGLYFLPLGGSEQFGVNFNLYGYKGKWLAVDLGIGFADDYFPGVDILCPDPSFIAERRKDLVGLVITHAHEDHIGAVAHLWPRLRCPLYCTAFTAAVLRRKFSEAPDCKGAKIHVISPEKPLKIGAFRLRFIHVSHSVPQTCAVVIETDAGRVVHSGDWNLDPAPVLDGPTDQDSFKAIGDKGVLAYIGDSTNAAVSGRSGSESDVRTGLESLFRRCEGRIAVTTFSSNIGRLYSIARAAEAAGRSVAVVGRSMNNMIAAAQECGYLKGLRPFLQTEEMDGLPKDQQLYIVTGSQGEPRAALSRIARSERSDIRFERGDMVVFSARSIPGNETAINHVKNNLVAAGVAVVAPEDTTEIIHVSGHPCRDEIVDMYQWLNPAIVVPVHGERFQLEAQAELARKSQIKSVIVPSNGSLIRLAAEGAEIVDHVPVGILAMENGRLVPADYPALAGRRKLQYTGALHATVVLDSRGELACDPQISSIGLVDDKGDEGYKLEEDMIGEIEDILADMAREDMEDDAILHEEIRVGLRRYVSRLWRIKPVTTVHIVRL